MRGNAEDIVNFHRSIQNALLLCVIGCLSHSLPVCSQQAPAAIASAPPHGDTERGGQHDFDFELGQWTTHVRRLLHPLTGSNDWVDLHGTSIVRKVWDGRANLGELEVKGATTHIEGLSMRLYNPQSHQWSIYWANSNEGNLGTPMIGQFKDGRGEFYDQELFQGEAIYVRFIFSDITPTTFRLEQAFSADGGKTWEPNWIATFARTAPESDRTD